VLPLFVLANKCDTPEDDELCDLLIALLEQPLTVLPVSAETGRHFDALRRAVYEQLDVIRIYTKPPGKDPDLDTPFVVPEGTTVEEFAGQVHHDFLEQLSSARVWGEGVFDGQQVARDHVLHEGDIVELQT
jgi:ribosome-interacting GTPase 1